MIDFIMPEIQVSSDRALIFDSPPMNEVVSEVKAFAPTDLPVLLTGENGTGKENIARLIHANSNRSKEPFCAINCSAISPNLIESELFGHEKGSFTGADKQKIGIFEKVNGGTLFLDEIGEMPPEMQVKLLRVLQDGELRRVGGNETIKAKPRIISATNIDIDKALEQGKLRRDLYYRLKGIEIKIPPLVDRLEDIPSLAGYFAKKTADELGFPTPEITKESIDALSNHSWPGNVRQLEATIRQATIRAKDTGVITPDVLKLDPKEALPPPFPTIDFEGNGSFVEKVVGQRRNDHIKPSPVGNASWVGNISPASKPNSDHANNANDALYVEKIKEMRTKLKSFFKDRNGKELDISEIREGSGVAVPQISTLFSKSSYDLKKYSPLSEGVKDKLIKLLQVLGKSEQDLREFEKQFDELRALVGYSPVRASRFSNGLPESHFDRG